MTTIADIRARVRKDLHDFPVRPEALEGPTTAGSHLSVLYRLISPLAFLFQWDLLMTTMADIRARVRKDLHEFPIRSEALEGPTTAGPHLSVLYRLISPLAFLFQ